MSSFSRSTLYVLLGLFAASGVASAQTFSITRAEWQAGERRLRVEGNGTDNRTVTIRNAGNNVVLGTDTVDGDEWSRRVTRLTQVPCTVSATQSGSTTVVTRAVSNRPANCGPVAGAPALPTLSIGNTSANEGNAANTRTFTVTLSTAAPAGGVTFSFATANDTATAGTTGTADYVAASGTGTIAAGQTSTTIPVTIRGDSTNEPNETFTVNITGATNTANATASATGTLVNDDAVQPPPAVSLRINDVTVAEGGIANFAVTLSAASTQPVTVVASTANVTATAGSDFTGQTNVTLTFPAGTTTQTFAVTTLADAATEGNETFNVNLSGATGAAIGDAQAVGTITNVVPPVNPPTVSINDVSVNEGATASFVVSLSAPSNQTVTVVANTANGTAAAGSDYTARSNVTITFPAGTTTQNFTVTTLTDTVTTDNGETFNVNLTSATNATIADAQGVGTIGNVNPPPVGLPSLSVNDVSVTEGNSATFTITLSAATTAAVTVNFSTSNGTATAGTTADYTAVTNRALTIPAGQTSVTTQVVTTNDTTAETTETFNVSLTNVSANATIADSAGVGTITDNDFTNAAQAHATMTTYDGPQTCVGCHEAQARQMHGSVHYQQNGPTDFVTNIAGNAGEGPAGIGKPSGVNAVIGINTYCGTHENSPRFTCANCHVGNGRWPKTPSVMATLTAAGQLQELANIDCLTCHQQAYKRFPDWTAGASAFTPFSLLNVALDATGVLVPQIGSSVVRGDASNPYQGIPNVGAAGDFMFRPAGAAGSLIPLPANAPIPGGPMALTTEQAAQQAHATTRQSCLNCHAGAAGANGAKRGDLSSLLVASTDLNLDRHMATTGSNMTCSNCHNVPDPANPAKTLHRVKGRGLDLRANDHATRFTCDNAGCHNAATVHNAVTNGATFARHTNKVACQTCHIPSYGKGIATEVARDWQNPHVTQSACNGRGGWLPNEIKSSTATPPVGVRPSYQWFDGNSQVSYLTESLAGTPTKPLPADIATAFNMPAGTAAYIMGRPNPNSGASAPATGAAVAKIYPMKEHWGKLARNTANNTLVASSTFEFFRTGSFCRAVAMAMRNLDPRVPADDATLNSLCPNQDKLTTAAKQTELGVQVVPVHTYQTINHGVEPQANALGVNNTCGACHTVGGMTGGPARLDLKGQLGYRVRTTINWSANASGTSTCSPSCHGTQSQNFTGLHSRSQHVSRGCNACHDQVAGR